MQVVRVTYSTNGLGQRIGGGVAAAIAAASAWHAATGGEFGFWVIAGFFGIAAGVSLFEILRPTELEFVVELDSLRFGPVGRGRTLRRSDIRELRFESGTDNDLACAIMKDRSLIDLSRAIISANQADLAERVAEAWPDVEIWLRAIPMTFPDRKRHTGG